MKKISAESARQHFVAVLNTAQVEPVTIEHEGLPVAVVISPEDFLLLQALESAYLKQQDHPAEGEGDLPLDGDVQLHSSILN